MDIEKLARRFVEATVEILIGVGLLLVNWTVVKLIGCIALATGISAFIACLLMLDDARKQRLGEKH